MSGKSEADVQLIFSCFKLTQAHDQGAAAGSVFDQGDDLLDVSGSAEYMFSPFGCLGSSRVSVRPTSWFTW